MPSFMQADVVGVNEPTDHAGASVERARCNSSRNSSKSGSLADRPNASSQGLPLPATGTVTWTTLADSSLCPKAWLTCSMASASVAATTLNSGMPSGWATYWFTDSLRTMIGYCIAPSPFVAVILFSNHGGKQSLPPGIHVSSDRGSVY